MVLRRSVSAGNVVLDPQQISDTASAEIARDLFEGLTTESPSGQTEPGVATDWLQSEGGRRYIFRLRPDAKWSNGDPVVASDFVRALRRLVDPGLASPSAEVVNCIVGATDAILGRRSPAEIGVIALDDHTLEFRLEHPMPLFPSLLASPATFPRHPMYLNSSSSNSLTRAQPISNGAYSYVDQRPGGVIHLEKNGMYWNRKSVDIPKVDYYLTKDATAEVLRYRAGELDVTSVLPPADFEWAKTTLPGELQTGPELGVYFFAFNLSHGPLQSAPAVREALALALDRDGIVSHALKAGQLPAYSFVPPGISGYEPVRYDWAAVALAQRRQRARILMNAAGFNAAHPLHLRIVYAQAETVRNLVIATAAQWHDVLGVEVEPEALEFRTFLARRNERQSWDVMVNGWNADYADPGNFLEVFRTGGPQNDPGLADPAYDRLLDQAEAEADGPRRLAVYARAEQHLLAGYAVTPMYFVATRRLVKPYVHGVALNPMNHNYTKHWSLDADGRR
jgi:oligopeptide transport system substrate-binding protein